jgi:hypothetical protein
MLLLSLLWLLLPLADQCAAQSGLADILVQIHAEVQRLVMLLSHQKPSGTAAMQQSIIH